jgi:hypothetical protein
MLEFLRWTSRKVSLRSLTEWLDLVIFILFLRTRSAIRGCSPTCTLGQATPCDGKNNRASGGWRSMDEGCASLTPNEREAEGEGFEPSIAFAMSVFKTDAIGHSATPPKRFSAWFCLAYAMS